jgi:hypothetical protein
MKLRLASLLFLTPALLAGLRAAADAPPPSLPAHTIANSQLRVLPRNAAGRQYQLHIGLPDSYATNPARRYPVVYVTDGYWDFQKITAIHGCLVYDKYTPEFITVGLGYAGENLDYGNLRRWELSPAPFGDNGEASGHAADFLKTIETEIIPLVDREYRTDPSCRVLCGASMGGLFTLYAMYSRPDLFQGYVAATPAVVLGNDWLFGYEEAFAKSGRAIKARLFAAVGGNESPGYVSGVLRFSQRIDSRKYEGLKYQFRIIEGERHAGMQPIAYTYGLQFVFAPRAPESGPTPDHG